MITAEYLRSRIAYNSENGEFTWLWKPENNRFDRTWNTLYAGKCAGKDKQGYRAISIDGVVYQAHRLAWLYVHGQWPTGEIDHINRVRDDNRIVNLRDATHVQNITNGSTQKRRNGLPKGAYRKGSRWQAKITVNWKIEYLGSYATAEEAHAAYKARAVELHGEFAA